MIWITILFAALNPDYTLANFETIKHAILQHPGDFSAIESSLSAMQLNIWNQMGQPTQKTKFEQGMNSVLAKLKLKNFLANSPKIAAKSLERDFRRGLAPAQVGATFSPTPRLQIIRTDQGVRRVLQRTPKRVVLPK
eukprot:NODE_1200_length_1811_cov_1.342874.p2 type:complete len:137 gc:universal NODE_1200_length_1811_cov_1.342874:1014-1424(+)